MDNGNSLAIAHTSLLTRQFLWCLFLIGWWIVKIRTYTELKQLDTLLDRFRYLSLGGYVGDSTFGFDRWINQQFYRSAQWQQ
jgi:hypothetical protein